MRNLYLIVMVLLGSIQVEAQNGGLGVNTQTPDASAVLDIVSSDKGLLIPRVSLSDVSNSSSPISSPATGLMVYNTNASVTGGNGAGFYYYDGSEWQPVKVDGADNLGDHTAGQNIELGGNWVSNDGDDEGIVVDNSGNVGIGTASPDYDLDVNGEVRLLEGFKNVVFSSGNFGNNNSTDLFFNKDGVGFNQSEFALYNNNNNDPNNRYFELMYTDDGAGLAIRKGGNVGIGITEPGNPLTVGDLSDGASLGIRNGETSSAFTDKAQIAFGFNNHDDYQHFIHTRHNSGAAGNAIDFYVCDGTRDNSITNGATHTMSLVSGYVGIAHTAPKNPLDVMGTARMNDYDIYLGDGYDQNHGLGYYGSSKKFDNVAPDGPVLYGWYSGMLGTMNGGQQNVLFWNKDGEVGIGGVTNPGDKLEVNGNIRMSSGDGHLVYKNDNGTYDDWRIWEVDDFESGTESWVTYTANRDANSYYTFSGSAGSSHQRVTPTAPGKSTFLRSTSNSVALRKLYDLSGCNCSEIKVKVTYMALDSWDNETAIVSYSDEATGTSSQSYTLWLDQWNEDTWGGAHWYGNSGDPDHQMFAEGQFHNSFTNDDFYLNILCTLDQGASDESFGIDNVEIWVK